MKIIDVTQGSDAWKAIRRKYRTASEASMIMNCHANVSRAELLRMKATGTEQEFSQWFEANVLENGHRVEAAIRPYIAEQFDTDLLSLTGVDDTDHYLASFDGIDSLHSLVWECKQWNEVKAAEVRQQRIPLCDYWQVVQQLMVSGADSAIYTVSDGTPDKTVSVQMKPKAADFRQLMAAWDQFDEDLKAYQHEALADQPKGKAQIELPALVVEITGAVSSSNLQAFQVQAQAMIQAIKTDLVTDQDFADAEQTVKALDAGEKELESVKARALAQTATIDELFKTIDSLKGEMRDKRLLLNKLVKSEKEARRFEQIQRGQAELNEYLRTLDQGLHGVAMPTMAADFAGAIKGKKTMQSIKDAIDSKVAEAKVSARQVADQIHANLELLNKAAAGYDFLFADKQQILLKEPDDLAALVKARIADHKEREQAAENERERIRREEEAKAKAEADLDRANSAPTEQPQKQVAADPRSREEIDITCWLFDNARVTQEQARFIADAIVTGVIPHVQARITRAA